MDANTSTFTKLDNLDNECIRTACDNEATIALDFESPEERLPYCDACAAEVDAELDTVVDHHEL